MGNKNDVIRLFYSNIETNFDNIDNEKRLEIIERAKKIKTIVDNKYKYLSKGKRYICLMDLLRINYSKTRRLNSIYASNSEDEKLLLLLYSVDPNFEAAIIAGTENKLNDVKVQMEYRFGVFDPCLIKLENYLIKNFISKEQKEIIENTINEKAFK